MVTVCSVISVFVAVVLMVVFCGGISWQILLDLPSLVLLAVIAIPMLCVSGFGKDFLKAISIAGSKTETTLVQRNIYDIICHYNYIWRAGKRKGRRRYSINELCGSNDYTCLCTGIMPYTASCFGGIEAQKD